MQEQGELTTFGDGGALQPSVFGRQDEAFGTRWEQERNQLHLVLAVVNEVSRHPDPRNAAQTFAHQLMLAVRPGIVVAVFLTDPQTERLVLMGYEGLKLPEPYDFQLNPIEGAMFGHEAVLQKRSQLYARAQVEAFFTNEVQAHHGGRVSEQVLVIPILYEGETIGIVNLEHYDAHRPFTEQELLTAEVLTRAVSNHFKLARLYESSRLKEQEMLNLNRVIQTVNSTLDLDTILKTIRRSLNSVFKFDVIFVQLTDREKGVLRVHSVSGNRITNEALDKYRKLYLSLEGDESLSQRVLRTQLPEILLDVDRNTPLQKFDKKFYDIAPFRSIAFFPLIAHQEEIGVISFASSITPFRLKQNNLEEIQRYVMQVANAIYNAFLFDQSRQTQQDLIIKNIAIQSQSEEIHAQNEALSSQSQAIKQQTKELESLVRIMQMINQEFELEKILDMLLDEGAEMIRGAQACKFLAFDSTARLFRVIAGKGFVPDDLGRIELSWKEAIGRYSDEKFLLQHGIYLIKGTMVQQPMLPQLAHLRPFKAMLSMAMMVKGAIVGFLVFHNYEDENAFDGIDPLKLQRFLEHAASAFFKARFVRKIQQQKAELELAYQKISDSISYARRILEAILPDVNEIYDAFPQSFVFFRPKDIVSGDFFWFSRKMDRIIIAAVDCTGHGIPGAFMSVLGNTLLNQIVNERGITDPGIILNELNRNVKSMLGQFDDESETFDGMDVALCTYDIAQQSLHFGGANRNLYHVSQGKIEEVKGLKRPVGGGQDDEQVLFASHRVRAKIGDTFYITTDGYVDQFGGGPQKRKFMNNRLKDLLLSLHTLPMPEQAQKLEQAIDDWRGRTPQLDDILVIGMRVTGQEKGEAGE